MTETPSYQKPSGSNIKEYASRVVRHENFVLGAILLALVAVFGATTRGLFVRPANLVNILIQYSTRSLAAVGQAFVILTAGIDLSVGGIAILAA